MSCPISLDRQGSLPPINPLLSAALGYAGEKQFATLREQFAMHGQTLHRTSPGDGPGSYYAERWGLVRYLPTLDDARRFLAQIGGTA
ncbi:MAG: hypothetical protein ACRECD_10895 [Burkholderiaceae bacterium]